MWSWTMEWNTHLRNLISSSFFSSSPMIFDVVTLTSTPSITNFLVFFSVLLEKLWEEKHGTTQFSQLEIWMNSACMSSHLPFKVLQLQKYFITTPVKVTGRSPAQAEHTSTRNQRVTQNPSNGMAKIKTIISVPHLFPSFPPDLSLLPVLYSILSSPPAPPA